MRVAIYARESTDDKGQDPENQVRELRAWCANSDHAITQEYVEHESGRKGADKRKQFAALFDDAAKRKFDLVLFWALDRFSREGMVRTIMHLQRLASYGVSFHSYTEPHLATDNELVRNILFALLSSLAKLEAQKIGDRTKGAWPEPRLKALRSAGRGSGSSCARKLPSAPTRERAPMRSPKLSASIGTRPPSMRADRPGPA